jgi:hypothetical protein
LPICFIMEYQRIILDLIQPRSLYNNSPVIDNFNIGGSLLLVFIPVDFLSFRFFFTRSR